jgi:hypothetical protein
MGNHLVFCVVFLYVSPHQTKNSIILMNKCEYFLVWRLTIKNERRKKIVLLNALKLGKGFIKENYSWPQKNKEKAEKESFFF